MFDPLNKQLDELRKAETELERAVPITMVMEENAADARHVRAGARRFRAKGEQVTRGVPASLPPLPAGAADNRLGLAQWLVDPANPLVARVTVNRYWQQYFGTGIVKTSDDFGSRGEWPTHPELLDWLAARVHRLRLGRQGHATADRHVGHLSASRRTSTPRLLEHDPYNRLLARGPRFRLDAEMIRDNALAVSGLLERHDGRAERLALSAGRLVGRADHGRQATCRAKGGDLYRRGHLHLLEAVDSLSAADDVRRAEPRSLHRLPPGPTRRCRRWCC